MSEQKIPAIGIAVPQANPTVEPELQQLLAADKHLYISRLTSASADSEQRLRDYFTGLANTLQQYGGMPLDVLGVACTASSYLFDQDWQQRHFSTLSDHIGYPILTACDAIDQVLMGLGAQRLMLLSPYPDWLNRHCLRYWAERGYQIESMQTIDIGSDNTYAIYQAGDQQLLQRLAHLSVDNVDAVLITGTGLPSYRAIQQWQHSVPLLSSNLCLAKALRQY